MEGRRDDSSYSFEREKVKIVDRCWQIPSYGEKERRIPLLRLRGGRAVVLAAEEKTV